VRPSSSEATERAYTQRFTVRFQLCRDVTLRFTPLTLSAKDVVYYIREHWGIENRLHWQLDVTFKEDACRARKNYSARNLNLLRKFTLAILRQQNDKLSLKARRWKCSLQPDYLKKVLGF